MSASELKYLYTSVNLYDECGCVNPTAVARKMSVSKVSVYHAIEKLENRGYIRRDERNKLHPTEEGKRRLDEYMLCIRYVQQILERFCHTPPGIAFCDAIQSTCAVSENSRKAILALIGAQKPQDAATLPE